MACLFSFLPFPFCILSRDEINPPQTWKKCFQDGSTALSIAMEAGHRDVGVLLYAHVNFKGSPVSYSGLIYQTGSEHVEGFLFWHVHFLKCHRVILELNDSEAEYILLRICACNWKNFLAPSYLQQRDVWEKV